MKNRFNYNDAPAKKSPSKAWLTGLTKTVSSFHDQLQLAAQETYQLMQIKQEETLAKIKAKNRQ